MKKQSLLAAFLLCALVSSALIPPITAQQQGTQQVPPTAPQKQQTPPNVVGDDDEVVQIRTNLVQVDAVVTDSKRDGRQVTDLQAEDFEIFENGERQQITNFSYVSLAPDGAAPAPAAPRAPADKLAPPNPPVRLRPEQVRRTIVLVVDDLGLSFESTAYVRQALRKYVDQQMGNNDLVAIVRTSAGVGAMQQFTSDKRQLYTAIERVRWYPSGRGGISAFAAMDSSGEKTQRKLEELRGDDAETNRRNLDREDIDTFREDIFAVGTLGTLNFIVRGLRELPGRKAVVLFSDGVRLSRRIGDGTENNDRVLTAMRRLVDLANRASVVFYTLDARGVQVLGLSAADDVAGVSPDQLEQRISDRRLDFLDTQAGLVFLAQQTGGAAVRNSNDLAGGVRRVLEDQRGYYLIGYRPDEKTFEAASGRRHFNKISVRLKNYPDLRVRTRSGFYGIPSEEARPVRRTREEQLIAALTSPFSNGEIPVRLASLFGYDAQSRSVVRSLLHVDARKLTYTPEADGGRKSIVDLVVMTFGEDGRVIDTVNSTQTLRARSADYETLQREGLIFILNLPVKRAGAYQLRAAVRDAATARTGSANQFMEVPNLSKDRLTLSGIFITGDSAAAQLQTTANGGRETSATQLSANPVLRRFRLGSKLDYSFQIYNAKLDHKTSRPQLQTIVRLFRDGQLIYTGTPLALDTNGQSDLKRLNTGGRFQINAAMLPGEYILQVIATDLLEKEKQQTAAQWIDFEIVK